MRTINELTKEEIEELIIDYQRPSCEITVAQIIEKYKLNIKAHKLAASLPEKRTEEVCPYCNQNMYAKIKNRSELGSPVCKKCGHVLYEESGWAWKKVECSCDNCQKAKKEEEDRKRKIIEESFSYEREKFEFSELSFREKAMLTKILVKCPKDSIHIYAGDKYFLYQKEIDELYEKGLIEVSPISPIEAFAEENFPALFHPSKVVFDINVKEVNANNIATLFYEEVCNASAEEKYELFLNIMHRDILERFEALMNERGLELEVLTNAEDELKTLYDKISYAQIMTLCYQVAKFYLDKTKTGKIYKNVAAKGAVKTVVTFYNNTVSKGWEVNNSEVNYAGEELKYYVTEIMKKDLRILREVLTVSDF